MHRAGVNRAPLCNPCRARPMISDVVSAAGLRTDPRQGRRDDIHRGPVGTGVEREAKESSPPTPSSTTGSAPSKGKRNPRSPRRCRSRASRPLVATRRPRGPGQQAPPHTDGDCRLVMSSSSTPSVLYLRTLRYIPQRKRHCKRGSEELAAVSGGGTAAAVAHATGRARRHSNETDARRYEEPKDAQRRLALVPETRGGRAKPTRRIVSLPPAELSETLKNEKRTVNTAQAKRIQTSRMRA